jgi:ribosomal protein L18
MACHVTESPSTDRDKNRQFAISRSRAKQKGACELTGTKCARKKLKAEIEKTEIGKGETLKR